MKLYRCGWCGHPTNNYGNPLNEFNITDYEDSANEVDLVPGVCCEDKQQEQRVRVTRDMAIDAGDLSLEGESY